MLLFFNQNVRMQHLALIAPSLVTVPMTMLVTTSTAAVHVVFVLLDGRVIHAVKNVSSVYKLYVLGSSYNG